MELDKPINQINLMLALARDWPSGYEIKPVFRYWGYSVKAVGRKFSLPAALYASLKDRISLNLTAKPDVILVSEVEGKLLVLECKTQSFGSGIRATTAINDDEPRQARTMMLLDPSQLAGSIGLRNVNAGLLAYIIATSSVRLQEVTLNELALQLQESGQAPIEHCVWGLKNSNDGVYLWNLPTKPDEVVVVETSDPSWEPLRIIPFDPSIDAKDEKGLNIFRERIRHEVAASILDIGVGQGSIDLSSLCQSIIPIWEFWDQDCKSFVLTKARLYLQSILAQTAKIGVRWRREQGVFIIEVPGQAESEALERYFSSPKYWQGDLEVQMRQRGTPIVEEPPED